MEVGLSLILIEACVKSNPTGCPPLMIDMQYLSFRREKLGVFTDAAGHATLLPRCCQSKPLFKTQEVFSCVKSCQQIEPTTARSILSGQRNLSKTDVSPLNIYSLLLLLVMAYTQRNFVLENVVVQTSAISSCNDVNSKPR